MEFFHQIQTIDILVPVSIDCNFLKMNGVSQFLGVKKICITTVESLLSDPLGRVTIKLNNRKVG